MLHKCLVKLVAHLPADFLEPISVRYFCCIAMSEEDSKPHNVANQPKDSCCLKALFVTMLFVNISDVWCHVDDSSLNHFVRPRMKNEVISGSVLALDSHCYKFLTIEECRSLVGTAWQVRIWRRCSSGA